MAYLYIDIMVNNGGRFYRTVKYEYNPLFVIDFKEMDAYIK